MENIPEWKRVALQAIDVALAATPELSEVHSDLRCSKFVVIGCERLTDLPHGDSNSLIELLSEVSNLLHDDGRVFPAKAIDLALAELTDAIADHVGA